MNDRLITRILFATDFSACAARAQLWAASLATAWDAPWRCCMSSKALHG